MMNRAEFMKILRSELRRLPEDERNSALEYYEESVSYTHLTLPTIA